MARPWGLSRSLLAGPGGLLPPRGEGEHASPLFAARKGVRRGPLGRWAGGSEGCLLFAELGGPESARELHQPHGPGSTHTSYGTSDAFAEDTVRF